jgi:hypothetical protein
LQAPIAFFRADRFAAPLFTIPEQRFVVMAQNPNVLPPVEIPAVDAAHAPFLYFDNARVSGHHAGIIRITLEAFAYPTGRGLSNGVG